MQTMWRLGDVEARCGVRLSEHNAMIPPSSVSAVVFAHPEAKYFAVGKIQKDQVMDYAARQGKSIDDVELALSSILAYQ
jgi:5-methyltetrahydrofolate--homocysteine methyltransferase